MLEADAVYTGIAESLSQQPQTLTAFLTWAASQHPEPAIALEQGRSPGRQVSYTDLVRRCTSLAGRLRKQGIQPGSIVPILTGRKTVELLVIQYALMFAGAAFAPMDPTFPTNVTKHKIHKCKASVVIAQEVDDAKLQELERDGALPESIKVIRINSEEETIDGATDAAVHSQPQDDARPDSVAYVMFTSGSTGNPKGVLQTHEQACAAMRAFIPQFYFSSKSRVLSTISAAWDISCCDTFATLSSGGVLCLSDSPDVLKTYGDDLDAYKITSTNVPPALVSSIENDQTIARLDVLISGGDKAETEQFAKWAKLGPKVFNGYGLTETGIGNLAFNPSISSLDATTHVVPLGKPYGANEVFIMEVGSLQEVGTGKEGEIVLGGPQIASGYLDEKELTAERFVRNSDGKRLFRTGDLGRVGEDGNVQLSGRADDVIKLTGYRIGPEEVQAPLREVLGKGSFCCATTIDANDGTHEAKLVLSFVPPSAAAGKQEPRQVEDASQLLFDHAEAETFRKEWQDRLIKKADETISYYARPAAYLPVRFIPLNSNHKHDRKRIAEAARHAAQNGHLVYIT
ncbi:unnamed protein product [Tilletia controversa]|uniref:AMP-dependent synthetase/ligase domain-containing protein n=3 Tax=Tilletia TaxID=13289 RepID=A0A8X7MMZ7_9BASI|nr:hypothetical protein CF336_g7158 [Tilletia laevis]KAE8188855.1 hypothetical protein CF328_g6470 [Tilletia controversa]KAE8251224.1 hypothetical protein A4X03_0g6396 [Tilletia caries]KAE8189801.1 hypothetical protein CF335_g6529 [Tilletia laevis]KAE8241505.1 hypothetical protein A4X06_0g7511 [Tilletia controversa]